MGSACGRISEPVPSHDRESLERDLDMEAFPWGMFLRLQPRDVLGLENSRSNSFPDDAHKRAHSGIRATTTHRPSLVNREFIANNTQEVLQLSKRR